MRGHDSKEEQRFTCARPVEIGDLDHPAPADEPIGRDYGDKTGHNAQQHASRIELGALGDEIVRRPEH
jgi:hypothetical protein